MAGNWTDMQKAAINANGCNTLVAAAAGSGKTAVLVERIIQKITDKDHPIDIDRMVVVTFTKAAAAEMKQRIRNALDDMALINPNDDRLQTQLTLLNNAQITTIDSFCLGIVRNYFSDIDLDPAFRTADEGEVELLENDIMDDMLEEYYSEGNEAFFNLVDAYGTGRDDSRLIELILKIYRFARSYAWEDEWYELCAGMYDIKGAEELDDNAAVRYIMNDIKSSLEDYSRIYDELEEICCEADGPAMYMAAIQSDHAAINMLLRAENFRELSRLIGLLTFDTLGRGGKKEISEVKKEQVKAAREDYKNYVNKILKKRYIYEDIQQCVEDIIHNRPDINMLITLAKDFSERMRAEKRSRNIVDFNDMEHFALQILIKRENGISTYTPVADALSEFYEEVLVDEYQDSNMLQEVILNSITRGRGSKAYGNMYMVGDVKQSIYKFRLACPELFIDKYDRYLEYPPEPSASSEQSQGMSVSGEQPQTALDFGGVKIELQTNFRSRANVLECTNDIFQRIMNPAVCKMHYDEKVRLNPGLEFQKCSSQVIKNGAVCKTIDFGEDAATEVHLVDVDGISVGEDSADEDGKTVEANVIADTIERLISGVAPDGRTCVYMVQDKNSAGGFRPICYSDIVILSRSLTGWADELTNVLLGRGIPAYSEASSGYFVVREIQLVLSYLKVIDNPLDDINLAAVLMSFFGNMTSMELAVIRSGDKKEKLYYQLIKNADKYRNYQGLSEKVEKFIKKLDEFRAKAEILSVRDLLWLVLYDTGYYNYVGTMPAGSRRQGNLDILLERAAAFEKTSYRGLFNFLRYVERMQKIDADFGEASAVGDKADVVHIMTIHKSKGLEFPVVILSGMGKKLNKMDASGELVIDRELGIGTDAVYLKQRIKRPTIIKSAISRKIVTDSISEEMRVLYVAMTRAKEKLYITGNVRYLKSSMEKWQNKADRIIGDKIAGDRIAGEGMYSYVDVTGINTYCDMIMPVVCMEKERNKGVFKLIVSTGEKNVSTAEKDVSAEEKIVGAVEKAVGAGENRAEKLSGAEVLENVLTDNAKKTEDAKTDTDGTVQSSTSALEEERVPEYPYEINSEKKAKVTVSELKQMQHDADFDMSLVQAECAAEPEDKEPVVPVFIKGRQQKLKGNDRGTAYHRVMECLDYSGLNMDSLENLRQQEETEPELKEETEPELPKEMQSRLLDKTKSELKKETKSELLEEIRSQLAQMVENEKMTTLQYKSVEAEDILGFCTSSVGKRVYKAAKLEKIRREQPFVYIDEARDEEQLIQGVIDLYFEEDGKLVIVDYKTDRVKKGKAGADELVSRYAVQLDYYAKALSQITGKEVKEKIIYSFTLGKEIIC